MTQIEAQKSVAYALDRASSRAGDYGSTGKQNWFLAKLLVEKGKDASSIACCISQTNSRLTKKQASSYIDQMINGVNFG